MENITTSLPTSNHIDRRDEYPIVAESGVFRGGRCRGKTPTDTHNGTPTDKSDYEHKSYEDTES